MKLRGKNGAIFGLPCWCLSNFGKSRRVDVVRSVICNIPNLPPSLQYILFYLCQRTKFTCLKSGLESTLVRVPKNTAVIQGTAVTFQCSSDDRRSRIHWYNSLCFNDGDIRDCIGEHIDNGRSVDYDFRPRFSVTPVNNATHVTRDLNINSTQLTDAGVYVCADFRRRVVISNSSVQLVVLGMETTYSKHTLVSYLTPK